MAGTQYKPILSPEQKRRLTKFFQRQRKEQAERILAITRQEMGAIVSPDGSLRNVASRAFGDVTGYLAALVVERLRGVPITEVAPEDGQTLVYDATAGELVYNTLAGLLSTRWEPVTNGDPDSPEIVFDGGDVVMEEVAI